MKLMTLTSRHTCQVSSSSVPLARSIVSEISLHFQGFPKQVLGRYVLLVGRRFLGLLWAFALPAVQTVFLHFSKLSKSVMKRFRFDCSADNNIMTI
jgi:hypothetical protein